MKVLNWVYIMLYCVGNLKRNLLVFVNCVIGMIGCLVFFVGVFILCNIFGGRVFGILMNYFIDY